MKNFAIQIFLAIGLLIGLFSCQNSDVMLRFSFQPEQETRYELHSRLRMIVGADSLSSFGSEYFARIRRKVKTVYEDHSARLQLSIDSLSYASSGRSQEECRHVERYLGKQILNLKMNSHGEILEAKTEAIFPELENSGVNLARMLLKIQPVLPSDAVSVGQRWERQQRSEIEKDAVSQKEKHPLYVYKWFEFVDLSDEDGMRVAKIRVNLKMKMDESKVHGIRFNGTDHLLGSGELYFSVESGDLLHGSLEMSGLLNAQVYDHELKKRLRARQIIEIRRLP